KYVKDNYPDSKTDLFAVFIEKCRDMTKKNGCQAMITMHSWMFLSSYEKLREKIIYTDFVNMVHLGARAFEEISGEIVQTTSFVFRNSNTGDYKGVYCRLIEPASQDGKEELFLTKKKRHVATQANFRKIPGMTIAYWIGEQTINAFDNPKLEEYATPLVGMFTTDNN